MSKSTPIRRQRRLAWACAFLILTGGLAAAAEDEPLVFEDVPEVVPAETGSGWYLRGDLGHGLSTRLGGAEYRTFDGVSYADGQYGETHLGNAASFGIGFGYQFNPWIRGDITAERQENRFAGAAAGIDCPASPSGVCSSQVKAKAVAYSVLANIYGDLGTFAGFTPYVGAGAGVSRVEWGTLDASRFCAGGPDDCAGAGLIGTSEHPGRSSFRFTYALMAGIAYDLRPGLKLDFGYRYRHVAGGSMSGFDSAATGLGATGAEGRDRGFSQHDLRIGLRYLFP